MVMEARLLMRAPLALRLLQHQRTIPTARLFVRHESYASSVNPQPPLNKPFSASQVIDLNQGPTGPVSPKIKQLQEFYQTPNGYPIWYKTGWDRLFFWVTAILTVYCSLNAFYMLYGFSNPKPVKKSG
ncbi:hypothetical protein BV898_18615 [Hypsibius exemplaris]|uniref:Uncharacterized protein n=1 Tax=Hypsibius exemplaris TaxID=2072580 RepID=A0A9X6NKA6_HYPEX|nr:hypothetical protein BV898_18615 [Hypsibius exemplaris]